MKAMNCRFSRVLLKINTFRMEDPNKDYYCYLRSYDGDRDTGTFLHIELKKRNVEGQGLKSLFMRRGSR